MTTENTEEIVFKLITHAGTAKSAIFKALNLALESQFEEAEAQIETATQELLQAHKTQTQLIQAHAQGEAIPMDILLVHAQDHMMTTMLAKDMAQWNIKLLKRLDGTLGPSPLQEEIAACS